MKHRYVELLSAESIATAGTKVLDINLVDAVTRITIQVKKTQTNNAPIAHPAKIISKIELVDGSDVLYSLSGIQSQAVSWYHNRVLPWNSLRYISTVQAIATFHMDFGRNLFDEEIALNPNKFMNLQLKITHNLASGGCTGTVATMAVFAQVFEESVTPRGFFMHKEIIDLDIASTSAHLYTDLPTDFPIRKLFIASLYPGEQPWESFNKIKLTEDDQKRIIINDMKTSDWLKMVNRQDWIVEELMGNDTDGGVAHYITPTYNIGNAIGSNVSDNAVVVSNDQYGGRITLTGDDAEQTMMLIRGLCPHGAVEFPFGKQEDPGDWYDVHLRKNVKLDITTGSTASTSATIQVFLQQFRTY
ncbi:MAG: hypothetical protein KAQ85_00770 [Thermodesulfovibrionia bacterium]|nr:hypothetical protein [Thermodesulfovibrionia bacterium]